jgi:hypothetical protein
MAKIRKTSIYPNVTPGLLDRIIITDVSDGNKTKSIRILDLLNLDSNGSTIVLNQILDGSVYWSGSGLLFESTVIKYVIDNVEYAAPISQINLEAADDTFDRYDVFAVNTQNELIVIKGEASNDPLEPQVLYNEQLRVALVRISANQPIVDNANVELIYNENVGEPDEWNATISPNTTVQIVNLDSTDNPLLNLKSIDTNDISEANEILFNKTTEYSLDQVSSFAFQLKNKTEEDYRIDVKLLRNNVVVGNVFFQEGVYGFDGPFPNLTQDINIPLAAFQLTDTFCDQVIVVSSNGAQTITGFQLDNFRFLSGIEGNPINNTWLGNTDVLETTYFGKAGYEVEVNNNGVGLILKKKTLHSIEDCQVRKMTGNTDYSLIESGDEVLYKKITNNGDPVTLLGHTYDPDSIGGLDKQLKSSYRQLQIINS